MKDTDKVTLTFGQLKTLVAESKQSIYDDYRTISYMYDALDKVKNYCEELKNQEKFVAPEERDEGSEYKKLYKEYKQAIFNLNNLVRDFLVDHLSF